MKPDIAKRRNLGEKLRAYRESRELGVIEFARLAGMSPSRITCIEHGVTQNPTFNTIRKIAKAFGMTTHEFMEDVL